MLGLGVGQHTVEQTSQPHWYFDMHSVNDTVTTDVRAVASVLGSSQVSDGAFCGVVCGVHNTLLHLGAHSQAYVSGPPRFCDT